MGRLLLLFIGLPAIELAILIEIGSRLGTATTLALIVVTGAIGASLARSQGLQLIGEVRRELQAGRLPAGSLVDGLLILIAAAVLVTPGVLTDAFGFFCLVPACRSALRAALLRRFERAVREERIHVSLGTDDLASPFGQRPMRDVTPSQDETHPPKTPSFQQEKPR